MDNNTNNIKVSVIIPLYKCSQYMTSLLDSVCGQSFRETEIICVLDGPDDEIRTIIEDRAKSDDRIICLEQEHSNAGDARNTGMAIAKGEYLLFLDADDQYSPLLIEKLYSSAKEHDADIVMCSSIHIDEWAKTTKKGYGFDYSVFPENTVFDSNDIDYLYDKALCVPWNKLFRHRMIKEQRLRFSSTRISNDFFFVCAAMTCAKRMVALKEDLITYRRFYNPDSLSSNRGRYSEDSLEVFEQFYNWLKKNGYWKRRSNDWIKTFNSALHYHAGFELNEAFTDGVAKALCTKPPWKRMSNAELDNVLNLNLHKLKHQQQLLIDETIALNTGDSAVNKMRLQILKNKYKAFNRIYAIAKQKYGRDLKKRTSPIPWFFWSIHYRGWHDTFRKIAYNLKGEYELSFSNVPCAGHITGNKHYISCFLPVKTYRERANADALAITVRCNGYYPLSASGNKGKRLTPLGPSRVPIVNNGAPTRKKELLHVFADVIPGLGIALSIAFTDPLYKNRSRDFADNNHPVSVNITGKIKLR